MVTYLGHTMGYLEGKNDENAKAYLEAYSDADIRRMQHSTVKRSETQKIALSLLA